MGYTLWCFKESYPTEQLTHTCSACMTNLRSSVSGLPEIRLIQCSLRSQVQGSILVRQDTPRAQRLSPGRLTRASLSFECAELVQ